MLAFLAALAAGVCIDWLFGDPPNKYHPVAWSGRLVGYCVPRLKGGAEKARGMAFAISLVIAVALAVHFLVFASVYLAGIVALAVASTILLKITIATRGMERHAKAIMSSLEVGDLAGARQNLSMI